MKRAFITLCLIAGCSWASGQRSYRTEVAGRLFDEARTFFELRDYPACIDRLERYRAQAATDRDLLQEADYMTARIAFEQGKKNAAEVLEKYVDEYPDSRHRNEICFLLGSAHFARKDYEMTLYWLSEVEIDHLTVDEQEACTFRRAYALMMTDDRDRARGYFARIRQIGHNYREAAGYYTAYIDYLEGDYARALPEFERLKAYDDYKEQALYYIAQIQFMNGRYEQVIRSGEALLRQYPDRDDNTELWRLLGNAYYQTGNRTKALEMLTRYAEATDEPLRPDRYLLGVCHFEQRDYARAIEQLAETVNEPDALTQNAYLYLGQCYLKSGDKENARMAFEMAATSDFDRQVQETAMYNYALLIHETSFSGFGESVAIFEDFLNRFANSKYADNVSSHLAEVYLTTKNYNAALTSIEKIRRPSAGILAAKQHVLFRLGAERLSAQDVDGAIGYLDRAIAQGDADSRIRSEAYFWRGEAYYSRGQFARAAADYQACLDRSSGAPAADYRTQAYYTLGYSLFKQQQFAAALQAFRHYVTAEKNTAAVSLADAYNRIGDCLYRNRDFAAAEQSYTRAASLQPAVGDYALYQKAGVMGLQKNYKGKRDLLDRLIRDYPQSQYADDALYEKGRTAMLQEDVAGAERAFTQLIANHSESSLARKAGIQLGLLYYNNNQPAKAAEAYKQVIANHPGSDEARTAAQDLRSVYVEMNDIAAYAAYINSLGGSVSIDIDEQDSLTYIAAERLYQRNDLNGARTALRNYLNAHPSGAFRANANYYLAAIAFGRKEYAEAKQRYAAVVAGGGTKYREEAWARKAEIEYLEKDYDAAIASFKQLARIAEKRENMAAARLGIMRAAQHTGRQAEALQAADELLKNGKPTPEVETEARLLRARTYLAMGERAKAETDLAVLSKDVRTAFGAEAKYRLAQSYFDRKETAKAEKEVQDFIKKGTSHQYWLARGFVLLADISIGKGDHFQARQYLNSLKNNYKGNDDIAAMIANRLSKLK